MNFPSPTNISRVLTITLLCAIYAASQAFALGWLTSFPYSVLLLTAFIDAVFFALLSVFLNKAIRFGNFVTLDIYQRFINYLALGLLVVVVWVGLCFLSVYLVLGKENLEEIWLMTPMKVFIGILLYIIIVQFIHKQIENDEEQIEDEVAEALPEENNYTDEPIEILDRVTVKIGQKIHVINVNEIIFIQSDGDYVQLHTDGQRFLKEETMKYFETHLPSASFVRVHRSYIVNVEKILRIELYEKRTQLLTLTNGYKIKTSVSGYKLLREALNL